MKIEQLIKKLQYLKNDLKKKDIYVIAKNGIKIDPEIKYVKKDISNLDLDKNNVEYLVFANE